MSISDTFWIRKGASGTFSSAANKDLDTSSACLRAVQKLFGMFFVIFVLVLILMGVVRFSGKSPSAQLIRKLRRDVLPSPL